MIRLKKRIGVVKESFLYQGISSYLIDLKSKYYPDGMEDSGDISKDCQNHINPKMGS